MGHINVDYLAGTKGWALTVDDDGVGMPAGEENLKPGRGTGIVEALSRQLEATVEVTDHAPGTRVSIVHLS